MGWSRERQGSGLAPFGWDAGVWESGAEYILRPKFAWGVPVRDREVHDRNSQLESLFCVPFTLVCEQHVTPHKPKPLCEHHFTGLPFDNKLHGTLSQSNVVEEEYINEGMMVNLRPLCEPVTTLETCHSPQPVPGEFPHTSM